MGQETFIGIVLSIVLGLYLLAYSTDTPKIKGLPEVPGLPFFGSLLKLGTEHAKNAKKLAERYGPVFQVRLGNRVSRHLLSALSA